MRFVAVGLDGLPLLHDGAPRFRAQPDRRRNSESNPVDPESAQLTNVVYMGMGEPLDNADNVLRSLEILTADWGYA